MEWYETAFENEYLRLYREHDDEEADLQIQLALKHIPNPPQLSVDVGCGAGRHLLALNARGNSVVGVDLSPTLLHEAEQRTKGRVALIRADMRHLPIRSASSDLVLSMFTSFGYFRQEANNVKVCEEWSRILRPNGFLFFDYLNKPQLLESLEPDSVQEHPSETIVQRRRLSSDKLRVEKEIEFHRGRANERKLLRESVRLYSLGELREMLGHVGFQTVMLFGDPLGHDYTSDSPRTIILARKLAN